MLADEVDSNIKRGIVSIKSEYLLKTNPIDPINNSNDNVDENEEVGGKRKFDKYADKKNNKRNRGQNKNRPHTLSFDKIRLCPFYQTCKRESCKFTHDVQEYMQNGKEEDIGTVCVKFDLYGKCDKGVLCRFGSAHIGPGPDYINIIDQEKYQKTSALKQFKAPPKEFQKDLRVNKDSYFTKTKTIIAKFIADKTAAHNAVHDTHAQFKNEMAKLEGIAIEQGLFKKYSDQDEEFIPFYDSTPELREVRKTHLQKIERLENEQKQVALPLREKKTLDFRGLTYLAPLTTVGNIPFRRICKNFGVDITCSEMAMTASLLSGDNHEWALTRRHPSENIFGLQICGNDPIIISKACELVNDFLDVDFVDLNLGCPIDAVVNTGAGSALLTRQAKLENIARSANYILDVPLTIKIRTGLKKPIAHQLVTKMIDARVAGITLHGRSQQQRYAKLADWEYIRTCGGIVHEYSAQEGIQKPFFFGNGDSTDQQQYWKFLEDAENKHVDGIMIGRGALMKPWIFKEIKDRKIYDISSTERLSILKDFTNYGLEAWGSDTVGVNQTRRFLCEWLSHLYRYVPVGLLEVLPQRINARPPAYFGRDELETLMASGDCKDWIKISEMLLGKAPEDFKFVPKHKSNAWE